MDENRTAVPECDWYAGCPNLSVGTVGTFIVGLVPTFASCADTHELDVQRYESAPG